MKTSYDSRESNKNNKLMCHSHCRLNFTNDVKVARYQQLETVLGDGVFYDTPEDTTTYNVKIRRVSKDNFKHDKCFTCDQKGKKIIWSKRRSISSRNRRWTCHFNRSNNSL